MIDRLSTPAVTLGLLAFSACASDDADVGEPLLAGSMTGEYDGAPFTPAFGFATLLNGNGLLAVGDGPIHCDSASATDPPTGTNALFRVDLVVGPHGSVSVQMIQNIDDYEGIGANTGSVMFTAVSDAAVAGSLSFDYTDSMARHFAISGSFEVLHCAP